MRRTNQARATTAPAHRVIPASIVAPPASTIYVPRPALEAMVEAVGNSRLTVLNAPAGSGKTMTTLSWFNRLKAAGRAGIWTAARAGIPDLGTYLGALRQAGIDAGLPWADLDPRSSDTDWLCELSAHRKHKVVLVVDDAQLLPEDVLAFLRKLIATARDALTTIIVSRGSIDIPLGRIRSLGFLCEVGPLELSFDRSEASELFERCSGVSLEPDEVDRLLNDMQGWPAGIVIAANQYRRMSAGGVDRGRVSDHLHAAFSSYFNEEVLALQPQTVRDFIVQTSVIEELTPSACAALTGEEHESAKAKMDGAYRAGLFIYPVDRERSCYAYHPLFRKTISKELIHATPALAAELHRRASCHYRDAGEPLRVIEHAKFCGDQEFLADQLESLANELIYAGYLYRIDELSAQLPWSIIKRRPMLLLALAWRRIRRLHFVDAERLMSAAAEIADSRPDDHHLRCLLHHRRIMLKAARDDMVSIEQEAPKLLYQLGDNEPYLSCSLLAQLMAARRELYHFHDMLKLEAETRRALESPRAGFASIALKATVAPTFVVRGMTAQARRLLEESLALAERRGGKGSGLAAVPGLPLAEFMYDMSELGRAAELVEQYLPVVRVWGYVDQLASGYLVHARLAFARDDLTAALAGLEEAHLVAIECGLDRLRVSVVAEQVRILLRSGMTAEAKAALRAIGIDSRVSPVPTVSSTRTDEATAMAWLRVEMHGKRLANAEKVAASWLNFLQRTGAVRSIVAFQLLAAEIVALRGNRAKARRAVRKALELAAPAGWTQIFLDEGEIIGSLIKESYTDDASQERLPADVLASRLVTLMRGRTDMPTEEVRAESCCLSSGLSARELSILTMVSSGLRNREIGERLGLTEGTVKWYLQQVYDRLGVRRRTQAVIRARQLGVFN
jgi:LuxR family maltose regulon positive regulatory protein